ncbi:uncharacterized protein LOC144449760 [Glandiceps talaboti]
MVSQIDDQIEGEADFRSKQESRPKGRRGGFFRLFRAFSGKKSYDQLDSSGDVRGSSDVIACESNVENCYHSSTKLNKKDGFLRRSFRRSKRKSRNARPSSMCDFRTLENRYSGSQIGISSTGDPSRETGTRDDHNRFIEIEPLPIINDPGSSVARTLDTLPCDRNDIDSEGSTGKLTTDKPTTFSETVNATGNTRDHNGDPTQIQLEIRAYSEIGDRLQVAETNIKRSDMKASVANAPEHQAEATKSSGVSKLSRRVSFKKGVVTKYSNLDSPDPVEVAEKYTPYPDLSENRQDDITGAIGKVTSPSVIKDPVNWTKQKLANIASKTQMGSTGTYFERHDSSHARKLSLSKLNRRVSFNAKSVVSSYADLDARDRDNDEVFIESNDSVISELDGDLHNSYGISTGVSEVNLEEFDKTLNPNKNSDNWKFWQGTQVASNDSQQMPRFKSNQIHDTDNTDNESMMSVSSTVTTSSTVSGAASRATRRMSSNLITPVRTYQNLNIPDENSDSGNTQTKVVTMTTERNNYYAFSEEIMSDYARTPTDKHQHFSHDQNEYRDYLSGTNSVRGKNNDLIEFGKESVLDASKNHDISKQICPDNNTTVMPLYHDLNDAGDYSHQFSGSGSNYEVKGYIEQGGEVFENPHSTHVRPLESTNLYQHEREHNYKISDIDTIDDENHGNGHHGNGPDRQSKSHVSGYLGLKSWADAVQNTASGEPVNEFELKENLGEFGRGEPKRQSKFRKMLKRRGSKNEKYPKGERF